MCWIRQHSPALNPHPVVTDPAVLSCLRCVPGIAVLGEAQPSCPVPVQDTALPVPLAWGSAQPLLTAAALAAAALPWVHFGVAALVPPVPLIPPFLLWKVGLL